MLKPDHPKGTLDLEVDPDGYIWVGMMTGRHGALRRKTEQFRIYPVPKEWQTDATQQSHFSVAGMKADGKIWVKNSDRSQVMKLDPETGVYENLGSYKIPSNGRPIGIYGIYADAQNNAYILEFGNGEVGRIDAKTSAFAFYPTPTPFSRARRGHVDAQDRLWFAEYGSNGVGMFIPRPRRSPSGGTRSSGNRLTTWSPTATARSGRSTNRPTASAGSIPRAANGSITRCRATATSAGCSSTTARPR